MRYLFSYYFFPIFSLQAQPHGLVATELSDIALQAHEAIVSLIATNAKTETLEKACERRQSALEDLIPQQAWNEIIEVSFAIEPYISFLPASCLDYDQTFVGIADVIVRHGNTKDMNRSTTILAQFNETRLLLRSNALRFRTSALQTPLVGVFIKSRQLFIASESAVRCDQRLFCRGGHSAQAFNTITEAARYEQELLTRASQAGRHAAQAGRSRLMTSRTGDDHSEYALGTKTVLVIPVCPTDDPINCFDYAKIHTLHNGNVTSFLEKVIKLNTRFYEKTSFNTFSLTSTIAPLQTIDYESLSCNEVDSLGYYYNNVDDAMDVMAFSAAETDGYFRSDYDFQIVVAPKCTGMAYSGIAWVGYPGLFLNIDGNDYDQSLAHELGHNIGGNHASFDKSDNHGLKAWWNDESWHTWSEYGNPFSIMGNAFLYEDDIDTGQIVLPGKLVFDWIDDDRIQFLEPFTSGALSGACDHGCGPYLLQATDDGELIPSVSVGIQVSTQTSDRYLFIEYRQALGGALLVWSDIQKSTGNTGVYGDTVLVDATPDTSSGEDSVLEPGKSILLDTGLESNPNIQIILVEVADSLSTDGYLSLTIFSGESAVTSAPSTPMTTVAPTAAEDKCTQEQYTTSCCPSLTLPVQEEAMRFDKIDIGNNGYCCGGHCAFYAASTGFYLHYIEYWDAFFVTETASCYGNGTLLYYAEYARNDITAACCAAGNCQTAPPNIIYQVTGTLAFEGIELAVALDNEALFLALIVSIAQLSDPSVVDIDEIVSSASVTTRRLAHRELLQIGVDIKFTIRQESTAALTTAALLDTLTPAAVDTALSTVLTNETDDVSTAFANATVSAIDSSAALPLSTPTPTAAPTTIDNENDDNSSDKPFPITYLLIPLILLLWCCCSSLLYLSFKRAREAAARKQRVHITTQQFDDAVVMDIAQKEEEPRKRY